MISPSVMIALETSWRMAASSCSGDCVAPRCFGERGLDGLEEGDVVAHLNGLIAAGAEGEGLRKFRHDLHEALLAVFLLEDVLLSGGNQRQTFGGCAVVHLSQLKPCMMSQAISCFSCITAMACAVSRLGSPWPPLSV